MKITNVQMLNLWGIFNRKFEETNDIKIKWNITEIAKEIYDIKSRFDIQKDTIINEHGKENEDGTKSLPLSDEHLQELFACESNISPIPLEELDKLKFSFEEVMALKPILTISQEIDN